MWVLTIGVLEVNPELDSIRAQRGHAQSALFSRVYKRVRLQSDFEETVASVSVKESHNETSELQVVNPPCQELVELLIKVKEFQLNVTKLPGGPSANLTGGLIDN